MAICHDGDRGHHAVTAPRQQAQETRGLGFVRGLAQDAATRNDGGVGGQDHARLDRGHGGGLFGRHARDIGAGGFALAGRLVDIGGNDGVRGDADLGQQLDPARAGRSQHESRPARLT